MITVFKTYDAIEADILKKDLEELGINVHIYSPNTGGNRPSLSFVEPIRVLVSENKIEQAMNVIKDVTLKFQFNKSR